MTQLSEAERAQCAVLGLPDSNTEVSGDTVYTFRFRTDGLPLFASHPRSHRYLLGTSFFRATHDPSNRRQYSQRALVAVSDHPYVGLHRQMVGLAGPTVMDRIRDGPDAARAVLEAVWHSSMHWPRPRPGLLVELPLLGSLLSFRVPFTGSYGSSHWASLRARHRRRRSSPRARGSRTSPSAGCPTGATATETAEPTLSLDEVFAARQQELPGMFQEIGLFRTFRALCPCLWQLWELAITGQPILLMAPSPSLCGDAVMGIVSLISPLTYAGDFRPYFTLYDPDFQTISSAYEGGTHTDSPLLAPRETKATVATATTTTTTAASPSPSPSPGSSTDESTWGPGVPASQQLPRFAQRLHPPSPLGVPLVLGTTNPFFISTMQQFPNALWLGPHPDALPTATTGMPGAAHTRAVRRRRLQQLARQEPVEPTVVPRKAPLRDVLPNPGKEKEAAPMCAVRSRGIVQPDRTVLSQLLPVKPQDEDGPQLRLLGTATAASGGVSFGEGDGAVPGVVINDTLLRQHFRRLTLEFLRPFDTYFKFWAGPLRAVRDACARFQESSSQRTAIGVGAGSPIPQASRWRRRWEDGDMISPEEGVEEVVRAVEEAKEASGLLQAERTLEGAGLGPYDNWAGALLPRFDREAFLDRMEEDGPPPMLQYLSAGETRALYRGFVDSAHFWPWFRARELEVREELHRIVRTLRLGLAPRDLIATVLPAESAGSRAAHLVCAHCRALRADIMSCFQQERDWIDGDAELAGAMRAHLSIVEQTEEEYGRLLQEPPSSSLGE